MSAMISSAAREPLRWLEQVRDAITVRPGTVLVLLLAVALGYWLWFGLAVRGLHFDEHISILAAQGILEHGYPRLPSGFFYGRDYLPHYLLAGSILAFGLNAFSVMVLGAVFGLGSLLMVYRIAKDIMGRPWLGVLTVVLMLTLETQTWYATSPRMYMPFQFFTLLAVYSVWRGYIEGQGKFKFLAVLAIIFAMLSHQQGIFLIPALPVAVITIIQIQGREWSSVVSIQNVAVALLLIIFAALLLGLKPPAGPAIVMHDGVAPDRVGLNLNPIYWGKHLVHIERNLPYGLALLPVAYFVAFAIRPLRSQPVSQHGLMYLLLVFTLLLLILGLVAKEGVGARFFFFTLGFHALLVSVGGVTLVRLFVSRDVSPQFTLVPKVVVVLLVLAGTTASVLLGTLQTGGGFRGGSAISHVQKSLSQGPQFAGLAKLSYRIPFSKEGWPSSLRQRTLYQNISQELLPGDLIISAEPMDTRYFLGSVDGYLRERKLQGGELAPFNHPTDEYLGIPLIDTREELIMLQDSDRRVWVVASKYSSHLSNQTFDILKSRYSKYYENQYRVVYVNTKG